jgi:hypothetical protein
MPNPHDDDYPAFVFAFWLLNAVYILHNRYIEDMDMTDEIEDG